MEKPFQEVDKPIAPTRLLTVMKRNSPCTLIAEIRFNPNLGPVLLTFVVFPLVARVLPA